MTTLAEAARLKQILAHVREIERKASLVLAQEAVYARNEKALTPNAPAKILEASKLLVDIEIACMALGLPLKDAIAALAGPASEASDAIQREYIDAVEAERDGLQRQVEELQVEKSRMIPAWYRDELVKTKRQVEAARTALMDAERVLGSALSSVAGTRVRGAAEKADRILHKALAALAPQTGEVGS